MFCVCGWCGKGGRRAVSRRRASAAALASYSPQIMPMYSLQRNTAKSKIKHTKMGASCVLPRVGTWGADGAPRGRADKQLTRTSCSCDGTTACHGKRSPRARFTRCVHDRNLRGASVAGGGHGAWAHGLNVLSCGIHRGGNTTCAQIHIDALATNLNRRWPRQANQDTSNTQQTTCRSKVY